MTWEPELAGLVDVTFSSVWEDPIYNDPGDLSSPGNLTYLMANKLGGVTGYNPAVVFTFTALQSGTMHLNIPQNIWSGQVGFTVDLSDTTTWNNLEITIAEDTSGGNGGGGSGNGGGGTKPPVNNPPVAVISGPTIAYVNETLTFSATNSTDDGTIVEYLWSFGDNHSGTGRIINYTYLYPGEYIVLLAITDDGDLSDTAFINITILSDESEEPGDGDGDGDGNGGSNNDITNNTNITDKKEEGIDITIIILLIIAAVLLVISYILKKQGR